MNYHYRFSKCMLLILLWSLHLCIYLIYFLLMQKIQVYNKPLVYNTQNLTTQSTEYRENKLVNYLLMTEKN